MRHRSHCLLVQMLTFEKQTVKHRQVGYLNFRAFLGAIKNHLGTFQAFSLGSLRNVVQCKWSFKKNPQKVGNTYSLHVFYGSVGHISISCLLVWRH